MYFHRNWYRCWAGIHPTDAHFITFGHEIVSNVLKKQTLFFCIWRSLLSQMSWNRLNDFLIKRMWCCWLCTHQACLNLCLLLFDIIQALELYFFHWAVNYELNMFSFSIFLFWMCFPVVPRGSLTHDHFYFYITGNGNPNLYLAELQNVSLSVRCMHV